MSEPPQVVGIAGSLRETSYTRMGIERARDGARRAGGGAELLDLREYDLPTYDADRGSAGDAEAFTARVREADAVLLGTPMYHGSYSSPLKTALDYCGFDEFDGTTVGLLTVAGGGYSSSPVDHLRIVARAVGAWVVPHQVAIQNASSRFENGVLTDEQSADRVTKLGEQLVAYATIEPDERTRE